MFFLFGLLDTSDTSDSEYVHSTESECTDLDDIKDKDQTRIINLRGKIIKNKGNTQKKYRQESVYVKSSKKMKFNIEGNVNFQNLTIKPLSQPKRRIINFKCITDDSSGDELTFSNIENSENDNEGSVSVFQTAENQVSAPHVGFGVDATLVQHSVEEQCSNHSITDTANNQLPSANNVGFGDNLALTQHSFELQCPMYPIIYMENMQIPGTSTSLIQPPVQCQLPNYPIIEVGNDQIQMPAPNQNKIGRGDDLTMVQCSVEEQHPNDTITQNANNLLAAPNNSNVGFNDDLTSVAISIENQRPNNTNNDTVTHQLPASNNNDVGFNEDLTSVPDSVEKQRPINIITDTANYQLPSPNNVGFGDNLALTQQSVEPERSMYQITETENTKMPGTNTSLIQKSVQCQLPNYPIIEVGSGQIQMPAPNKNDVGLGDDLTMDQRSVEEKHPQNTITETANNLMHAPNNSNLGFGDELTSVPGSVEEQRLQNIITGTANNQLPAPNNIVFSDNSALPQHSIELQCPMYPITYIENMQMSGTSTFLEQQLVQCQLPNYPIKVENTEMPMPAPNVIDDGFDRNLVQYAQPWRYQVENIPMPGTSSGKPGKPQQFVRHPNFGNAFQQQWPLYNDSNMSKSSVGKVSPQFESNEVISISSDSSDEIKPVGILKERNGLEQRVAVLTRENESLRQHCSTLQKFVHEKLLHAESSFDKTGPSASSTMKGYDGDASSDGKENNK